MKERRKNKFESKNGMIIVDATGKTQKTTYPPIGIGYNRKLMARRQSSLVAHCYVTISYSLIYPLDSSCA